MNRADQLVSHVVDQLIADIETGTTTGGGWRMPWQQLAPDVLAPTNAATGRRYTGGNRWVLAYTAMAAGLDGGQWATYRQWQSLGAQVTRGSHALAAVVRPVEYVHTGTDNDTGEQTEHRHLTFRAAAVFHVSQVDGWQPPTADLHDHEPIAAAEQLAATWRSGGMDITEGGNSAYYDRGTDTVHVPGRGQFPQLEHFYSTLAHEAGHWTGPRVGRDLTGRFGTDAYAAEELVAELTAAIIGAHVEISQATRDDHAAYVAGWLRILKTDPRHLWTVASAAEVAADYLITSLADDQAA